jgi:hypothetical protein
MFVPWQAPGRREPARVTAGAFKAAGVPVPEHPAQRNIYQLTRRQGLAWTPGLDAHIRRRGGELLGHGHLILVDIDSPAGVDGRPLVDALRWLADRAVEAGELLDLSATVSVRTPGHPASGHLAGWHLWHRAAPAPATTTTTTGHGRPHAQARLADLIRRLLAAPAANETSCCSGPATEGGQRAVAATIRPGFQPPGQRTSP